MTGHAGGWWRGSRGDRPHEADGTKGTMKLTDRELGTVLAALRLRQSMLSERVLDVEDIATNDGEFESLDEDEIDGLCERLNCEGEPAEIAACRRLVKAYEDGADAEHVEWSDVDEAYRMALAALDMPVKAEVGAATPDVQAIRTVLRGGGELVRMCMHNGCTRPATQELSAEGEWWGVCEEHAKTGHPLRPLGAPQGPAVYDENND